MSSPRRAHNIRALPQYAPRNVDEEDYTHTGQVHYVADSAEEDDFRAYTRSADRYTSSSDMNGYNSPSAKVVSEQNRAPVHPPIASQRKLGRQPDAYDAELRIRDQRAERTISSVYRDESSLNGYTDREPAVTVPGRRSLSPSLSRASPQLRRATGTGRGERREGDRKETDIDNGDADAGELKSRALALRRKEDEKREIVDISITEKDLKDMNNLPCLTRAEMVGVLLLLIMFGIVFFPLYQFYRNMPDNWREL